MKALVIAPKVPSLQTKLRLCTFTASSVIRQCFNFQYSLGYNRYILIRHCNSSRIRNIKIEWSKATISQQYTSSVFPFDETGSVDVTSVDRENRPTLTLSLSADEDASQLFLVWTYILKTFYSCFATCLLLIIRKIGPRRRLLVTYKV